MPPVIDQCKLLTTNQLAELLQLTPDSIRADRVGKNSLNIPFIRLNNGRVRYRWDAVQESLNNNTIK